MLEGDGTISMSCLVDKDEDDTVSQMDLYFHDEELADKIFNHFRTSIQPLHDSDVAALAQGEEDENNNYTYNA